MADPGIQVMDLAVVVTQEDDVDHARKQIRDAAVAALTTALVPGTAMGVHAGRVHPFQDSDLPAVSVYTGQEDVDRDRDIMEGSGSGAQWRRLELLLEIRAKVTTGDSPDLLSVLDTVALEAERALEGDGTLAGLLKELDVVSTTTELEGEDTERPVGLMTMTWGAVYRCNPADPAVLA